MIAHCYANGVIVFGKARPRTLPITHGDGRKLRRVVSGLARHAYDGRTLLVPGLPEASSWNERSAALVRFKAEVELQLGRPELARKIAAYVRRAARRKRARRTS